VVEGKLGREALLVDKPELAVCLGAAIYGLEDKQEQERQRRERKSIEAERQFKEQQEQERQKRERESIEAERQLREQQELERQQRERESIEAEAQAERQRSFYSHLANCLAEQGYDVNPHFGNKQMNEILENIKNLKGIGLIACKRILISRIVVAAIRAEDEGINRILIANQFHQYLLKLYDADIVSRLGVLLFVFSSNELASEFIKKEQNYCKLFHFWKSTQTLPLVVDQEKKEIHSPAGTPQIGTSILNKDQLIKSLFFN
jgi:hypothetical protein